MLDPSGQTLRVGRKFIEKRGQEFFVDLVALDEERATQTDKPGVMVIDWDTTDVEPSPVYKNPGTDEPFKKPDVTWVEGCPNQESRNGTKIKRIVLHYTTAEEPEGSISWFKNPKAQVSAHYIVDRRGKIWQLVLDANKAWHAYGENADSIGIEHCATKGERLTDAQESATIALQRYLCSTYKLDPRLAITAHRFTPHNIGQTDCPGSLWLSQVELANWVLAHFSVIPVSMRTFVSARVDHVVRVVKKAFA